MLQPLASTLLFRSMSSIWSLIELQTFSFADTGAFRNGFKFLEIIHLNFSIRNNIMISLCQFCFLCKHPKAHLFFSLVLTGVKCLSHQEENTWFYSSIKTILILRCVNHHAQGIICTGVICAY